MPPSPFPLCCSRLSKDPQKNNSLSTGNISTATGRSGSVASIPLHSRAGLRSQSVLFAPSSIIAFPRRRILSWLNATSFAPTSLFIYACAVTASQSPPWAPTCELIVAILLAFALGNCLQCIERIGT